MFPLSADWIRCYLLKQFVIAGSRLQGLLQDICPPLNGLNCMHT